MPLRIWNSLNAFRKEAVDIQEEEEEEGGEYLFDPEAGKPAITRSLILNWKNPPRKRRFLK
jgi:hypothetical protein